ncbi:MAG: HAMP domain-containing sensor histidine kinase [Nanoarchaeota archaeon]|nr:HAMP domain-containing sensor histidine kinase [Nanoarchaeota archaeon]
MAECRKYGLGFWQCPNSLFLIMGVIIIVAMIITYFIGLRFLEPEVIIVVVSIVTIILLIIGHSLVGSFARVAEANRMKSEFVGIVSHQLRTPLSSLKWSLELLRNKRLGEVNDKQMEYLDVIKDSNDRMIKLVNDLLSVNRIDQQRLEMRPKNFNIDELIEKEIKELMPIANAHSVNLQYEKPKNLPQIYADQDKVQMVVQNLIDNAIKYSKKEGGSIMVNAETDRKNNKMVKITVKDDGVGIPDMFKSQIFGKFFRGDNLIKQRVEGTGLGLFIAKGIIHLSGGEINFHSEENQGSTFWFTLPIANN